METNIQAERIPTLNLVVQEAILPMQEQTIQMVMVRSERPVKEILSERAAEGRPVINAPVFIP